MSDSHDATREALGSVRTYDAPQLRMDTWNELLVNCAWLRDFARGGRDIAEPRSRVEDNFVTLRCLEFYWAFPGLRKVAELDRLFAREQFVDLQREAAGIVRLLVGDAYRERGAAARNGNGNGNSESEESGSKRRVRPYFEVLFVDDMDAEDETELRTGFAACRRDTDEFTYDIVTVPSVEDAVIAVLFNPTIQACFLRYNYAYRSSNRHPMFGRYLHFLATDPMPTSFGLDRSLHLARFLRKLRPELDLYLVTDTPLERVAGNMGTEFRRTFYRLDQFMEQHLSVLKGMQAKFDAPFFEALRKYSSKPTGVFHALPIARGKSMTNSHWARDLLEFYGPNIFMAETSATSGGLDSLLQPRGPIKRAQDAAARTFGARHTYFVTNGTSTANKIVMQALVRPGDIVLIDRDCHKSHHYAMVLAGAQPVYLDSYPLTQYSMYGGVTLETIERNLLALRDAGKLDRVRMLLLTNCTFDGLTYDPQRVMRRVLAIKPDMIFLWDEAWFAFASASPVLRRRTAMPAAKALRDEFRSAAYREAYLKRPIEKETDSLLDASIDPMPDPERVRVRVYATQSTHKTLTSLRQGSMIHIHDEDFEQKSADSFHEAFMTHTSTSPNYQIVASLDVGRRQFEIEGYELVERSIGLAMTLRERIYEHPAIRRYFSVLRPADMIPPQFRPSGLEFYYNVERGWGPMERAWLEDEFTLDPTRVTVHVGASGLDGNTFRNLLLDQYDIQINKTSRNTALFLTNIGTTRGDVAHLVDVLARIARDIDEGLLLESASGLALHTDRVESLLSAPALPHFSRFHDAFRTPGSTTPEGDLRRAFFLAYDDACCEWLRLRPGGAVPDPSREYVSAAFVTPYPPGFPILVPGQVITPDILGYLAAVDVKEVHGLSPRYGLRVFAEAALRHAARNPVQAAYPQIRSVTAQPGEPSS